MSADSAGMLVSLENFSENVADAKEEKGEGFEAPHQHSLAALLPASALLGLGRPRLGQVGVCEYGCNLQGASEVKLLLKQCKMG